MCKYGLAKAYEHINTILRYVRTYERYFMPHIRCVRAFTESSRPNGICIPFRANRYEIPFIDTKMNKLETLFDSPTLTADSTCTW